MTTEELEAFAKEIEERAKVVDPHEFSQDGQRTWFLRGWSGWLEEAAYMLRQRIAKEKEPKP